MPPESDLTPHGKVIERARKHVLRISGREAARRANISESRWRQVVNGYHVAGGQRIPARPTVRTLIAMALAVEVDPREVVRLAKDDLAPGEIYPTDEAMSRMIREGRAQHVTVTGSVSTADHAAGHVQRAADVKAMVDQALAVDDEEIKLVLSSDMTDADKTRIIRMIHDRRTQDVERTRNMIRIVEHREAG